MFDGPKGLEGRYPATPIELQRFMIVFPIVVVGAAVLGLAQFEWFWWIAIFCGIGWIATLGGHMANILQRAAYSAAIDDFALIQMAQEFQAGKAPPNLQALFNEQLASLKAKPDPKV